MGQTIEEKKDDKEKTEQNQNKIIKLKLINPELYKEKNNKKKLKLLDLDEEEKSLDLKKK